MTTETTTTDEATTVAPTVITDKDLQKPEGTGKDQSIYGGPRGIALLIARKAYALADLNDFKGTVREEKAFPKGNLYSKGGASGSFWKISMDTPEYKAFHNAASKAIDSINTKTYDASVKKAVDAFSALKGLGGGGNRGLQEDSLKGISL